MDYHQQFGFLRLCERDHGSDRMTGDNLGSELDAFLFRDLARLRQRIVKFVIFRSLGFDHFVDRSGDIRNFLHRDHMQRRTVQLGNIARQRQRLLSALRAVIGDHDMLEHLTPPAWRGRSSA
jgi:hypothetical protein